MTLFQIFFLSEVKILDALWNPQVSKSLSAVFDSVISEFLVLLPLNSEDQWLLNFYPEVSEIGKHGGL